MADRDFPTSPPDPARPSVGGAPTSIEGASPSHERESPSPQNVLPLLDYAPTSSDARRSRGRITLIVALLAGVDVAAILMIAVLSVETVLFAGPLIVGLALVAVYLAGSARALETVLVAAVHLLACVGAFTLIWWNGWGPDESAVPLSFVSAALAGIACVHLIRRLRFSNSYSNA